MKFAEFDKKIIKDNVDYSVKKITEIIEKIGPRESASKEAFEAMELLRKDLEKFADETHYETYKMAPRAFQHFTKTISAATIGAIGQELCLNMQNRKSSANCHALRTKKSSPTLL